MVAIVLRLNYEDLSASEHTEAAHGELKRMIIMAGGTGGHVFPP